MTSAFSWQNSPSFCPASFCTLRPNLSVIPGISWLPTFAFQFPVMKRTSVFGVISKRSCRSSIEPVSFSFFCISCWGIDLDYCDVEWFALGKNRDHSVIFVIALKCCISWALSHITGRDIGRAGLNFVLLFNFWLKWVFIALHRPSPVVASGGYSSVWYMGFLLQWLLLLRGKGSKVQRFQQFWNTGPLVVAHRLSCSMGCGIFPD